MSVDQDCSPELTAMLGASIATSISDIPFDGPIATTQVGLVDGEFVFNPTADQREASDLALTVASTKEKVIMIEAGAKEVPEDRMIEAIFAAHDVNQKVIAFLTLSFQSAARQNTSMRASQFRRNSLTLSKKSFRRTRWRKPYLQMINRREKKTSV